MNQDACLTVNRILWTVDANSFASLCLLNKAWYKKSQSTELYAHHLSRCPSYALANNLVTGPFRKNDLFRLKAKFAAEVRRNLFDAYLQPRETLINLISVSANSSAAFPGGEAFRFEFSPNGRTILAISSSRIYVLDASSDVIEVKRELKTVRRPLSASVTDDGSLLAVLSSRYQANIYGLREGHSVKHLQVIVLDNPPKTIALAHEGTVLAAAWTGGIEVFSLSANALSTDRRAVRSEAVDSLAFSGDGSMLVGSSHDLEEPNAVVVTAPFYTENDPNITPREIHSRMWTTQILFPQISSTVSHVALLQGHTEGDTNWLFAYDHTLMSYRAVRTDDTRSGVAYFLSPPTEDRFEFPQPCMAPVTTSCGTLAAAGFNEHGLWLYGVPEKLDVSPDMGSVVDRNEERQRRLMALTSATGHIEPLMAYSPSVSGNSVAIDMDDEGLASKVDWRQSLFVKCKNVRCIDGFTCARWVENSEEFPCAFPGKRLITTAPAGMRNMSEELGDENMPVDGSRICLLDFDYSPSRLPDREYTVEIGDNEPELLTEQLGTMEVEVALERRRTVRATRAPNGTSSRVPLARAYTAASPPVQAHIDDVMRRNIVSQPSSPSEDALSPMTRSSGLSRSITAAAGYQQARFPPRPPLGSSFADNSGPGQRLPHRPSIDSWETPPPPYGQDGVLFPSRPQSSSPRLQAASSSSSQSATVNGNLAQLGTFQHRNQQALSGNSNPPGGPLPNQSQHIRQSTGMDGMMVSEHAPTQRTMMQYGGLARSPRPGNIPEEGNEQDFRHRFAQTSQPTPPSNPISPIGSSDNYFGGGRPSMPTNNSSEIPLNLRPTMTHPTSPPTPEREAWLVQQQQNLRPMSVGRGDNRLSLTGANLQNRLNQPVPPVPPDQSSVSSYRPTQAMAGPPLAVPYYSSPRPVSEYNVAPHTPTPEQLARLNRRSHSPGPPQFQSGYAPHQRTASRDFGAVPPSPPPGAWGAAGVPGSPSFNRAIATPNGLLRNNSRGSNRSISASRSTPNLLLPPHSPRPNYQRLDTINSVNSAIVPLEHERSHSVTGNEHMTYGHENRRVVTDPALAEQNKKGKKKKKDGEKGGRRCVVM